MRRRHAERPDLEPVPAEFGIGNTANCGLVNLGDGGFGPAPNVDASNNFWGAPSGPGADPADNAGPSCGFNGAKRIVKPFATAPV